MQMEGACVTGTSLSADFANILIDASFSDVVLLTRDGDRLPASRIILAARSPVFRGMFMNGMWESNPTLKEVQLPAITTPALLSVLEYIYTGTLSKHSFSLETVCDVIHAARYFLLLQLEENALQYFRQTRVQDVDVASKCLSRAVEVLSLDADESLLLEFVRFLKGSSLESSHLSNFSHQALRYYLQNTSSCVMRFSVSEYARLRCAILWCACALSKEAKEVLAAYLPAEHLVLYLIAQVRTFERYRPDGDAALQPRVTEFRPALTSALRIWLPLINLSCIHPQLLFRIIEPLGILPPFDLAQAFRFQALYSVDMSLLRWKEGAHGQYYSISEEGSVIEGTDTCKDKVYGYARAALGINKSSGLYEWDFIVEKTCPYLGLGICSLEETSQARYNDCWLGCQPFGWVLHSSGHLQHSARSREDGKIKYGQAFGDDSRIRVRLDMEKRSCSFTIDDEHYGVAWENLPAELYPAVTCCAPGRVRLQLVSVNVLH